MKVVGLSTVKEENDVILDKVDSDPGFGEWVRRAIFAAPSSSAI